MPTYIHRRRETRPFFVDLAEFRLKRNKEKRILPLPKYLWLYLLLPVRRVGWIVCGEVGEYSEVMGREGEGSKE